MKSVYVAGHTGLVGSALARRLTGRPGLRLVTVPRSDLDLLDSAQVERFLQRERPEAVVVAAGLVGGIQANSEAPARFIYENLMIEANLIHRSWKAGVKRLLNFGSSCMYPRECSQPMRPEQLMEGKLEPTSEPYAVAKLAGLSLCRSYNRQYGTRYITVIPCTVYGPGDNFDLEGGHVISALLRRFHEAKERGDRSVTLWGTGRAQREFLYSDDAAEACDLGRQ
jgi:nucleoside-diphosphate-sugar epimerase